MLIRVEAAEISNHSEGVVLIRFLPSVGVDVAQAREIIDVVIRISEGKLHGNLADARELLFMTNEARMTMSRQSPSSLSSTGILVASSVQRALSNLYLSVARPTNPTKLFATEAEAVAFIRSHNEAASEHGLRRLSSAPPRAQYEQSNLR